MLMPKRVKYRKPHSHPRIKGPAKRGVSLAFGEFGLKALEPKWVTARQIEASRVTISRHLKKGGKLTHLNVDRIAKEAADANVAVRKRANWW